MTRNLLLDRMTVETLLQRRSDEALPAVSLAVVRRGLFLHERVISSSEALSGLDQSPALGLKDSIRLFETAKTVTRYLTHGSAEDRSRWAREIVCRVNTLAIHAMTLELPHVQPCRIVLLSWPDGGVSVFLRPEDGRVFLFGLPDFEKAPQDLLRLVKVLALDRSWAPTPDDLRRAASILPTEIRFPGNPDELRWQSSLSALAAQFQPAFEVAATSIMRSYCGVPGSRMNACLRRLWHFYRREVLLALRDIDSALDAGALALVKPHSVTGAIAFHYFRPSDPIVARNRQQAARSFPVLSAMLPQWQPRVDALSREIRSDFHQRNMFLLGIGSVDYASESDALVARYPDQANVIRILDTIDRAKPLNDMLSSLYGLSRSTLRALRSIHWPYLEPERFSRFCRLLESVPGNLRPQTSADLAHFDRLLIRLTALAQPSMLDRAMERALQPAIDHTIAAWLRSLAREARQIGWQPIAYRQDIGREELDDFVGAFAGCLVARFGEQAQEARPWNYGGRSSLSDFSAETRFKTFSTLLEVFAGLPLRRVARLIDDWHRALQPSRREATARLTRHGKRKSGIRLFPTILRRPRVFNGLFIVPLLSVSDLLEEGEAMQHCVSGYSLQAASGHALLFSVRDASGNRLSTIELQPNLQPFSVTFRLIQNKSRFNAPAPRESTIAVSEFMVSAHHGKCDLSVRGMAARVHRLRRRNLSLNDDYTLEGRITQLTESLALARVLPEVFDHVVTDRTQRAEQLAALPIASINPFH